MSEPPRPDFGSFYRATLAPLRRYLARMLGSRVDAQDVAHDAYARIYKAMGEQRVAQPKAFLFTTARRLALNQIKRRRVAPVREMGDNVIEFTPSGAPGVARVVMARQEWTQLQAAIAVLPDGCREVLLLCKADQLSHAEISRRLGIAVSTIEKQHARALRLLRAALHDDASARGDASKPGAAGAPGRQLP